MEKGVRHANCRAAQRDGITGELQRFGAEGGAMAVVVDRLARSAQTPIRTSETGAEVLLQP